MAAAFALGADAVQIGTRFIATEECIAHANYKKAILEAGETDTIVAGRSLLPARRLKSAFSLKLSDLEKSGVGADPLNEFVGQGRARKAQIDGDLENGDIYSGASAGLIKKILPAAEIVNSLVEDCNHSSPQNRALSL